VDNLYPISSISDFPIHRDRPKRRLPINAPRPDRRLACAERREDQQGRRLGCAVKAQNNHSQNSNRDRKRSSISALFAIRFVLSFLWA
jgi:hypothetical protein